ncbi:MAG: HAD hydrolase-like protein [Pseudomonadota bacterium]
MADILRAMSNKRSIFFDLDGTLTDPYDGIRRCIEYALTELGHPVDPDEDFRWCIGPPLMQSFEQRLGAALAGDALRLYRARFSDSGWRENTPYDGIHDALHALCSAGHTLFVATSKPAVFAERILKHFDLARFFQAVYGPDLDGRLGDKRDLLAHMLATESDLVDPVMVGDREHDMIGASSNGVDTVGVLYGFGTREELLAAGAARLVESPAQLRALFG